MKVAVLGASPHPDRYSHQAMDMLKDYGHEVYPVNPAYPLIDEVKCYASLKEVPEEIHTLTVYLSPERIMPLIADIISVKPKRVIMNPGAESDLLAAELAKAGIPSIEACTLVMLRTGQF